MIETRPKGDVLLFSQVIASSFGLEGIGRAFQVSPHARLPYPHHELSRGKKLVRRLPGETLDAYGFSAIALEWNSTQKPLAIGREPSNAPRKTTAMTNEDDPPTPSIPFSTTKTLLSVIREAKKGTGDAIQVEGVTPEVFAEILEKRPESEKFRVFFSEPRQVVVVTIPMCRHEIATWEVSSKIYDNVKQMGLGTAMQQSGAELFSTAAGGRASGPGEPDGSFTPILRNGEPEPWPSIVIEAADSQPIGDLRHEATRWLLQSNYAVKAAILVKIRAQSGTITLEKWIATESSGRAGATATRASARRYREPGRVQEVRISRPGVGNEDAARLNPESHVVARGPLRLEFAELFLRQPGPGEYDILFDEAWLRDMAVRVWRRVY